MRELLVTCWHPQICSSYRLGKPARLETEASVMDFSSDRERVLRLGRLLLI